VIVEETRTGIVPHRGQQCFDPLVADIGDRARRSLSQNLAEC
jgi:hypothetical protein